MMYWTERGDPPSGNTVNPAPMDVVFGKRKEPEIVFTHLMEGSGLSLDLNGGRMFLTDLAGSVTARIWMDQTKDVAHCARQPVRNRVRGTSRHGIGVRPRYLVRRES